MPIASIRLGKRNLLLNPPKSPSMRKRGKAKLPVKVKD